MSRFGNDRPASTTSIALIVTLMASIAAVAAFTAAGSCPGPAPEPSASSTPEPTGSQSDNPTPTGTPTPSPSNTDTGTPTPTPSSTDTGTPTATPSDTAAPAIPTALPTIDPTTLPTTLPTLDPTALPTIDPTALPILTTPTSSPDSAEESPAPDPCREGSLTIAVNPSTGVYGTMFTIAGVLTCEETPVADAIVIVSRLTADPDDFEASAARSTDADGRWSVLDRPSAAAEYVATWRGGATCGAGARSDLAHASVRPGIAVNPATQAVRNDGEAVFSGRIIPMHPGQTVGLQILQGSSGRWADAGWVRLDADSRFRIGYRKTDGPGWLAVRIVYPTQDGDHAWNVSRSVRADWS